MSSFKEISDFSEEELEGLSLWNIPNVSAGKSEEIELEDTQPSVLTVDEIEVMQQQAYQEASDKGKKEGYEAGVLEGKAAGFKEGSLLGAEEGRKLGYQESKSLIEEKLAQFVELLASLNAPLEKMDEQVEQSIVQLSSLIAKQVVLCEIKLDPDIILAVIKKTIKILPVANQELSINLHPDDIILINEGDMDKKIVSQWNISEDASLTRGGCRVSTAVSTIDMTVENRLSLVIANVLDRDVLGDIE